MGKLNFEVSKAIVGEYKVVNTTLPCLKSQIGYIDFRAITLAQAEKLVNAGTRYLKKVKVKEVPKITIKKTKKGS